MYDNEISNLVKLIAPCHWEYPSWCKENHLLGMSLRIFSIRMNKLI